MQPAILSIGVRPDGQYPLKGAISALEIYISHVVAENEKGGLPDALRELIISDQMIKNDGIEPPAKKKTMKNQSDCSI